MRAMRTSNIQHRTSNRERNLQRSMFSVRCSIFALIAVLCVSTIASAQEPVRRRKSVSDKDASAGGALASTPSLARGDEITPQQKIAVEKGLTWLAARQTRDGSYGGEGLGKHAGITALAGLAFMQDGNLPGRGKYGDNVQRCLDFVLA